MPQSKWIPTLLVSAFLSGMVIADSPRTFFSFENQFPRWEQLEVGVTYQGTEIDTGAMETETTSASIYFRYGILDDLAIALDVPYATIDPEFMEEESGLGDVTLSIQLRAYEDIFGYPYFLPYVDVSFATGDEDLGLGAGEVTFKAGAAFGSKINDWISWSFDVGFKSNPDELDNQLIVGHSYVWEISEQFGLLTEVLYEQSAIPSLDDSILIGGGFIYDWTPDLQMDLFIAGGADGAKDVEANARVSYSF